MSDQSAPYVVSGRRRNGSVTYLCPDAGWALRKRDDFLRIGYTDITAKGPDGTILDEQALRAAAAPAAAVEPVAG